MNILPFYIPQSKRNIVYPLILAAIISGFLASYRFIVSIRIWATSYNFENYNNAFAILSMAAICAWCARYAQYRLIIINKTKDFRAMKNISLIAAICCALRTISALVYFYIKMGNEPNAVTIVYVIFDILLWIVLTLFFLNSWSDKKTKEEKRIKLKMEAEAESNKASLSNTEA